MANALVVISGYRINLADHPQWIIDPTQQQTREQQPIQSCLSNQCLVHCDLGNH